LGIFQTGARQWNRLPALASLAPFAPFALNGCSISAVPDEFLDAFALNWMPN
jgi:hypothetical protein